jgi:hypothetical protein
MSTSKTIETYLTAYYRLVKEKIEDWGKELRFKPDNTLNFKGYQLSRGESAYILEKSGILIRRFPTNSTNVMEIARVITKGISHNPWAWCHNNHREVIVSIEETLDNLRHFNANVDDLIRLQETALELLGNIKFETPLISLFKMDTELVEKVNQICPKNLEAYKRDYVMFSLATHSAEREEFFELFKHILQD